MRRAAVKRQTANRHAGRPVQVNIRIEPALHQALVTVARQERRSVPQAALRLIEEGLQHHTGAGAGRDDVAAHELARLAAAGGAFDWLAQEPDLYDDTSGEPV